MRDKDEYSCNFVAVTDQLTAQPRFSGGNTYFRMYTRGKLENFGSGIARVVVRLVNSGGVEKTTFVDDFSPDLINTTGHYGIKVYDNVFPGTGITVANTTDRLVIEFGFFPYGSTNRFSSVIGNPSGQNPPDISTFAYLNNKSGVPWCTFSPVLF